MGALKVLLGLVLLVVGLALLFAPQLQPGGQPWWWVNQLVTVVAGVLPVFLVLVGLFVVWLEMDEIKSNRQLAAAEKEEKSKKKKK